MEELFSEGFPDFMTWDQEVKKYIKRIRETFQHLDITLFDKDGNALAAGWGVPISWTGNASDLPKSFADSLRRALECLDSDLESSCFVICGGVVHPKFKGSGVAQELILALKETANKYGLHKVIAPLRPTLKHLYPLMTIEDYSNWVREDGLPWDPWLRLHVRLGAQIIGVEPNAQTMQNTIEQWESYASIKMPVSGQYIIPKGMTPLSIDTEENIGTYTEPNIWVSHK